jgi:YVTN family beta-propeller protein
VSSGPELPSGTVTFLFTDIEGSTRLLKQLRERYTEALSEHQRILREAFAEHGGREIDTQGDSFFVAFRRAKDAVGAAVAVQRGLAEHTWPEGAELRVRVGIHTGEPVVGGERYVGLGVHRAARICAAGHGGQVLVSQATRELLRDDPLPDVSLRDLGEHQLKDLDEPERVYQLIAPGLAESFPPLKATASAPFAGREGELVEAAQEAVQDLARPWLSRRRVLAVTAVIVAAAGAVLGVLLTRGGTTSAGASGPVAANAVGVIDAKSGRIVSQIPVGIAPSGVAAGPDAVWVTNADDDSVSRIDPQTNEVRQTIRVGGGPAGVASSEDAVWVANGLAGTVSRIDPQTNQVTQTITVGNGPSGVTYGEKAVWVANSADGTISRLDPATGRVTLTVPAVVGSAGVAVGFGRVWVVSPSSERLVALDSHSGEVLDRIGVGVDPAAVTAGAGAVWVANRADGTVSKVDPRANAVTDTVQVGRSPDGIAAGPDGVWVSNGGDGTLTRIDPSSDAVVSTVRLANPPQGLALSPRGVYVAVRSSGQEHRGGTLRVVTDGALDFIDPALAYTADSWGILTTTNDGLVGFRRVGGVRGTQLVPDLAVSLPTATDGGRAYTFQLRPGIRYSTGSPVEPEDIRAELERVLGIGKPVSGGRQLFGGIVGADRCTPPGKTCDLSRGIVTNSVARTVTFHLTAPDPDFLTKLALPFAFAVPADTPARDVGTQPVPATGPYMIGAYRNKRFVKLVRNPRFHQWSSDAQPDGYPEAVTITWSGRTNPAALARAVERGAADVALGLSPPLSKQQLDLLALRYSSQLRLSTGAATSYFFLNTRVPPFDDVRVRRAVNYAFDRQAFAALLGRAFAPTCQILPPNFPGYRRTCPYLPGGLAGLDKARQLVRNSGTTGARVIVWVPEPVAVQGRYMVSVLDALGYRASLKTVRPVPDIVAYFDKVLDSRVRAQIGYTGWVSDYPSDLSFLREEFGCAAFVEASPQLSSDPSGFCDRSIDTQMAHATLVQAQDPPAAIALWQRVEQEILAKAPVVPTYNGRSVDFVSRRIGNYQFHPQFFALLDQLWVK